MSSAQDGSVSTENSSRDQGRDWSRGKIEAVPLEAKQLLEQYNRIPSEQVLSHILYMVGG